jgi:cysteine synthase
MFAQRMSLQMMNNSYNVAKIARRNERIGLYQSISISLNIDAHLNQLDQKFGSKLFIKKSHILFACSGTGGTIWNS